MPSLRQNWTNFCQAVESAYPAFRRTLGMNSTTHPHPLHYHTWKDIGGPLGLLLDGAFCAFVILAALSMIVFAFFILVLDYIAVPVITFLGKIRSSTASATPRRRGGRTLLIIRPRQTAQALDVVADAVQFRLQRLAIAEFIVHPFEIERIKIIIVVTWLMLESAIPCSEKSSPRSASIRPAVSEPETS